MKYDVQFTVLSRLRSSSISSASSLLLVLSVTSVTLSTALITGCASGPALKTQKYAKLNQTRVYEYEFPKVWKGIEEAMRRYRVIERNPNQLSPLELKKTTHRTLKTDWVYAQSKEKYVEYTVNGSPRKTYPQTRYQLILDAQQVLGGVSVQIQAQEEIELLNDHGESRGYERSEEADPALASDLLDRINLTILSLPNTD